MDVSELANKTRTTLAIIACALAASAAHSDSSQARCGYATSLDLRPETYQPCVFSQRQGYISIYHGEETLHEFTPAQDTAGTCLDGEKQLVYRKKGLADEGQLFQLPDSYLYVLWDPAPSRLECSAEELTTANQCQLGYGNVGFSLQATSGSSINTLTLTPSGLEIDNSTQTIELDGTAYLAELADLDSNGWPEVYIYVSSAGSGSYGSLVAYAVNNGKTATPIYLPPLSQDQQASEGYQGHDEFRVVEQRLVRRFPVYLAGDTNANPTGGIRQIQYRLAKGEAGWILLADRVVNY